MNRRSLAGLFAVTAFLASAPASRAGFVVSSSNGAAWRADISLDGSSSPSGDEYWDNGSWDGTNLNIGFFLTGTGGFAGDSRSPGIALGDLRYFGTGSGRHTPYGVRFGQEATTAHLTTILIEMAGYAPENELWYRDTTGEYRLIFPGSSGGNSSATFTAVGQFTLLLRRDLNDDGDYNDSGEINVSSGATWGNQFFSVFHNRNDTDRVYVGVEDLRHGDWDYNDMVISLSEVRVVPEPSTLALAACGAAGLGLAGLRRWLGRRPACR